MLGVSAQRDTSRCSEWGEYPDEGDGVKQSPTTRGISSFEAFIFRVKRTSTPKAIYLLFLNLESKKVLFIIRTLD